MGRDETVVVNDAVARGGGKSAAKCEALVSRCCCCWDRPCWLWSSLRVAVSGDRTDEGKGVCACGERMYPLAFASLECIPDVAEAEGEEALWWACSAKEASEKYGLRGLWPLTLALTLCSPAPPPGPPATPPDEQLEAVGEGVSTMPPLMVESRSRSCMGYIVI